MTTITIPRETFDLMERALEEACGNRCNAEYNPCYARDALSAAKAVSEPKIKLIPTAEELGTPVQPQAQAEAIAWVLEWTFNGEEKGRRLYDDETHCKFDAEQYGGVCRPLVYGDAAHPQATEPAGWTGKTDIDAALIMLDRLDVQGEGDDARVDEILRTLRKLAAAPEAKQ